MSTVSLSVDQALALARTVLVRHGTSPRNADSVARALVAGDLDGQAGHGLSRLPSYAAQVASGKVDGMAEPAAAMVAPAAIRVDAANGFAYPALDLALDLLIERTRETGIALAVVHRSHHCGMMGAHVERLAQAGLIGLMVANSPVAMAPWGGDRPVFGTNPIAFAAPRADHDPLVVDLSLSKVARGKIMVAAREGRPIPEGWALDAQGRPTTDAQAALDGSMVPMGDAKGAALALMVEILAAALPGAALAFEAASFLSADGPPPAVGQTLLAIAPGPASGNAFAERLETLLAAIASQPGTRLPGDRRFASRTRLRAEGLALPEALYRDLARLAGLEGGA
jgi:(2R)-3-sulfolactate dehydrogenase (NADP+)